MAKYDILSTENYADYDVAYVTEGLTTRQLNDIFILFALPLSLDPELYIQVEDHGDDRFLLHLMVQKTDGEVLHIPPAFEFITSLISYAQAIEVQNDLMVQMAKK